MRPDTVLYSILVDLKPLESIPHMFHGFLLVYQQNLAILLVCKLFFSLKMLFLMEYCCFTMLLVSALHQSESVIQISHLS